MNYNDLFNQLKSLQEKANTIAEQCDKESDALFYINNKEPYAIQKKKCEVLDAEWEKLDEAVEVTRNLITALETYNDFAEAHEELGLL